MKKIILFTLVFLLSIVGYSQDLSVQTESFDGGIPATWAVFDNGVGTSQKWQITSNAPEVYSAPNSSHNCLPPHLQHCSSSEYFLYLLV